MATSSPPTERPETTHGARPLLPRSARYIPLGIAALLVLTTVLILHSLAGAGARSQATSTGFAAFQANHHLFQSVDGSATWTQAREANLSGSTNPVFYAASPSERWMAAVQAGATTSTITVAHTTDDGASWSKAALPAITAPYAQPKALTFADSTHGWLEVDLSQGHQSLGMLFATSDGGATWTSSSLPYSGTVSFISPSVGWLVGGSWTTLQNTLSITRDGGKTWTDQTPTPSTPDKDFQPVVGTPQFFDNTNGMLAVNFGRTVSFYTTHDGGATWAATASATTVTNSEMAPPIAATDGQTAWVVVGNGLYVSHDAGATWTTVAHSQNLAGVQTLGLLSDTSAWALTENGVCASFKSNCSVQTSVLRSTDGGGSWSSVSVPGLG